MDLRSRPWQGFHMLVKSVSLEPSMVQVQASVDLDQPHTSGDLGQIMKSFLILLKEYL